MPEDAENNPRDKRRDDKKVYGAAAHPGSHLREVGVLVRAANHHLQRRAENALRHLGRACTEYDSAASSPAVLGVCRHVPLQAAADYEDMHVRQISNQRLL